MQAIRTDFLLCAEESNRLHCRHMTKKALLEGELRAFVCVHPIYGRRSAESQAFLVNERVQGEMEKFDRLFVHPNLERRLLLRRAVADGAADLAFASATAHELTALSDALPPEVLTAAVCAFVRTQLPRTPDGEFLFGVRKLEGDNVDTSVVEATHPLLPERPFRLTYDYLLQDMALLLAACEAMDTNS